MTQLESISPGQPQGKTAPEQPKGKTAPGQPKGKAGSEADSSPAPSPGALKPYLPLAKTVERSRPEAKDAEKAQPAEPGAAELEGFDLEAFEQAESSDSEGESAEEDHRGRHATIRGQGFSWVLTWTIVGALIPGTGLIAAGRRWLGGGLLLLIGFGGVALAGLALMGNPVQEAISLAVDPKMLLLITIGIGVGALLWAGLILLTNLQLSRYATLDTTQRVFSGVVVLALITGVALPAYAAGHSALIQRDLITSVFSEGGDNEAGAVSTGVETEKDDPWADKARVNVLLIGSDAGKGRIGVRPDTMIVASIDTEAGDAVLFSLPRNLERAPFPKGTPGREAWPHGFDCGDECLLNAIWTWGSDNAGYKKVAPKNPGLRATKDAIEGVTGLKIDTYVMLNLQGFAKFVNALGGLRIDVDERLPIGGDSEHPEETTGYIEKGKNQLLDGYESLWYARSRWSTNDFDRMRRQRCVIAAVVDQSDPVKLALAFPAIAKAAKANISTGIPQREIQAWVELSQRVKSGSVRSLPFTDEVITNRADPDYDKIHELVKKALKPVVKATPTPEPSTASSASPSPSPAKEKKDKKASKTEVDPSKAQDVTEVC